jgi:hypothetical protein
MSIDNPCLAACPLQACNYIIACYIISLMNGETIKGLCLHHVTLMGYVYMFLRMHTYRSLPKLSGTAAVNYISIMKDAVRNWELIPDYCMVIQDRMFQTMSGAVPFSPPDSFHTATTNWSLLVPGHCTGFYKSEWC